MRTVEVPIKPLWPRTGLRPEGCRPSCRPGSRPLSGLSKSSGTPHCTRRAVRGQAASDQQPAEQVGTGTAGPPGPEHRWDPCKFSQSNTFSGREQASEQGSCAPCAGRIAMIQRSPCWPFRYTAAPISCSITHEAAVLTAALGHRPLLPWQQTQLQALWEQRLSAGWARPQ